MQSTSWRGFLSRFVGVTVGFSGSKKPLFSTKSARVFGTNERVRLVFVSAGGRGMQIAADFAGRSDVKLSHVCDLYEQ